MYKAIQVATYFPSSSLRVYLAVTLLSCLLIPKGIVLFLYNYSSTIWIRKKNRKLGKFRGTKKVATTYQTLSFINSSELLILDGKTILAKILQSHCWHLNQVEACTVHGYWKDTQLVTSSK